MQMRHLWRGHIMGKHDALNYLASTRILEFPRRCAIYEPTRQHRAFTWCSPAA